ncbi:hypothetical protein [Caulobacter mirabilis]|uniref:Uncharacterized protein n=1 Tax=Caulobacter mirabilis TaxID=69666 RepID=A0A2D2B259_9CAUL|nr:hypothetical protein [Caulobacter mirabilis]ATQ44324.1 hypothetical protein CSW64_18990 [Caulobacter mirabilis]
MNRTIDRLKIVFLIIFAVACAALWAYQLLYVLPAKNCEAQKMWWDAGRRICAQPLYIPDITRRPAGMSRKEWSEKQAARQVEREAEGYPSPNGPEKTEAPAAPAQPAPAPAPAGKAPAAK